MHLFLLASEPGSGVGSVDGSGIVGVAALGGTGRRHRGSCGRGLVSKGSPLGLSLGAGRLGSAAGTA